MLLQIHDFAEDFRPSNYRALVQSLAPQAPEKLSERLYPQGSAIHYAVLNSRDQGILHSAGVSLERLHTLPNPVAGVGELPERMHARRQLARHLGIAADERYVLYPVRGIRRKNLGELLLWGAAHPQSARFAITMPPLNPVELPAYEAWRQLASDLRLPVLFDVGVTGGVDYCENLAAADLAITTSVAEGFGMVFLETWLSWAPVDWPQPAGNHQRFRGGGSNTERIARSGPDTARLDRSGVVRAGPTDELRQGIGGLLSADAERGRISAATFAPSGRRPT